MIFRMLALIPVFVLYVHTLIAQQSTEFMHNWPLWRGPLATGEAPYGDPPVNWDENTNIRWKFPLPGLGHATPVVWGDRIYVLTAVPAGTKDSDGKSRGGRILGSLMSNNAFSYEILAINRTDGSLVWRKTARVEPPHEGRHEDASWASCSRGDRW